MLLYNRHAGVPALVLATGPSASKPPEALYTFKGVTIGVNRWPEIEGLRPSWSPDYWLCWDPGVLETLLQRHGARLAKYKGVFVRWGSETFEFKTRANWTPCPNEYALDSEQFQELILHAPYTPASGLVAIAAAIHMGCSTIYSLGNDFCMADGTALFRLHAYREGWQNSAYWHEHFSAVIDAVTSFRELAMSRGSAVYDIGKEQGTLMSELVPRAELPTARLKSVVVLPARYASSRLPGKPLIDFHGKPLLVRSFENVRAQTPPEVDVVVVTDSELILAECARRGIPCELTGEQPTGTDRCAEFASRHTEYEYVVNAQPDEPLLADGVIRAILADVQKHNQVCCGLAEIKDPQDIDSRSVGKVLVDKHGHALYISRARIPYSHSAEVSAYYTQVCVYGFTRSLLLEFHARGMGDIESAEGIELLRCIENHIPLRMVPVPGERHAVDTPEDVIRVRELMRGAC